MTSISEASSFIQNAFDLQSKKRSGLTVDAWLKAERNAVFRAAHDYAMLRGLKLVSMDEVERQEKLAMGHSDYGAKWARGVASCIFGS